MDKSVNTLPIQTYVRSRAQTIVVDVDDLSSGAVALNLAKPSDVTVIISCPAYLGQPEVFVAAIDRTPSFDDYDVIISPTDENYVKSRDRVTLHLLEGEHQFEWKGFSAGGQAQSFPAYYSRLALAIDQ